MSLAGLACTTGPWSRPPAGPLTRERLTVARGRAGGREAGERPAMEAIAGRPAHGVDPARHRIGMAQPGRRAAARWPGRRTG